MFDRIEAGTFIIAGALIGQKLKISGVQTNFLNTELKILKKMGVNMKISKNHINVFNSSKIKPAKIKTKPYPGFPTDLQAQIMVLMTKAKKFLQGCIYTESRQEVLSLTRRCCS